MSRLLLFSLLFLSCRTTSLTGTWTGRLDSPNKIGVRFVLEQKDGKLTGRTYWEEPNTGEFEPAGEVTGEIVDGAASWTSETGVKVTGHLEGAGFVGTLTFPADEDEPAHSAGLNLSR
jgi:hypothetical protein